MSRFSRVTKLMVVGATLIGAVVVGSLSGVGPGPDPVVHAQAGSGGEFHALTPARIFDSRPDRSVNDPSPGKKPTGPTTPSFDITVAGKGGLPADPSHILAIVANVTVVEPELGGWLAAHASGVAPTTPSALVNFSAGRNVPNLGILGVGSNGKITVKLFTRPAARAHVVIDVFGWISTSSAASEGDRLIPVGPARLVDTRRTGRPLRTDQTLPVKIHGATSYDPVISNVVPPAASAVLVNIAAVNTNAGSQATYVSATPVRTPAGQKSTTANVNVVRGQVKTSMAIVPIGPDGNIYLRNNFGDLHVVVDVFGYFAPPADDSTNAGRIVPLAAPFRAFDTRAAAFGNVPLGTASSEDWSFTAFANSVRAATGESLSKQQAIIGNLTGTRLSRVYPTTPVSSYLTAFPGGSARPIVSNVNIAENEDVPNMSLLRYGRVGNDSYIIRTFNYAGGLHYVLDVYAIVLAD